MILTAELQRLQDKKLHICAGHVVNLIAFLLTGTEKKNASSHTIAKWSHGIRYVGRLLTVVAKVHNLLEAQISNGEKAI